MSVQQLPPFDVHATFRNGDPYPAYATYRAREPVHLVLKEGPVGSVGYPNAYLFGHADCLTWLRDQRLGRELPPPNREMPPERTPTQPDSFSSVVKLFKLFQDPPTHTRLRSVVNPAFTPRKAEKLRHHIESIALELVNGLRDTADGRAELIGQFAYPLPMLVIAEVLGIPREDFRTFRSIAGDVAAAIDVPGEGLEESVARVDPSKLELSDYLRKLISCRRADPRDDLLSEMIHAGSEQGRLNESELVATCILLIFAGHETTVNLIGNGTLALLRNPDQWRDLVAEPGLAKSATEELLRYDAPVQLTERHAFESIEISGVPVAAGTQVSFMFGSANRDEAVFDNADRLDIRRKVGRIMSFGMRIHFCPGAHLARMEGEIAVATLAREFPKLALVSDTRTWRPGAAFHGLQELPLALG